MNGRIQTRNAGLRQERREAGEKRNAAWRALTPAQQLKSLDDLLGKGLGAKRQRAKLDALLHPNTEPVVVPTTPTVEVKEPQTEKKQPKQDKKFKRERKSRSGGKKG
jgi:hypothetical protein